MVTAGQLLILVVASGASLFMAWTIGAGSSGSAPFAPAVGARAVSVMRAGFFVGLLGLAGAILQGANVADTVGTGLVGGVSLTAPAATILLLLAAGLVAIGVFTGYPIATAFTVTGAVIGVGLVLANIPFTLLGSDPGGASIATIVTTGLPVSPLAGQGLVSLTIALFLVLVLRWDLASNAEGAQRHFLLMLGGLVAFSADGSQVGLAVGPLLAAITDASLSVAMPAAALLAFGGIGILAGSWMGAPRLIKAIAQDYSSLGPRRSIAALVPSFAIAQAAVLFGIPVSFNEIIVSAVVGSGFAAGSTNISTQKILFTVVAWVGSFALAVGVGYGAMWAIEAAF